MATDTTALAEAIAGMRAAVAGHDLYANQVCASNAPEDPVLLDMLREAEQHAGRALLAALEGVPEELRAYNLLVCCLDDEARARVKATLLALKGKE